MRGSTILVLAMLGVACSTGTGAERPDRARGEVTAYTWADWGALPYNEVVTGSGVAEVTGYGIRVTPR